MSTWGSVILWLSMIWLPPLLGLFLRNEAKPKKNIIVGTTLPHEAQGDPAVLALTARYKRELKWVCLALMLPAISGVFIRDFGLNMLLWMIWILVICVAVNIPYVRCNRALRRLKADRGWRREPSGQAVADLRAAAMELKWLSPLWFLPPVVMALVPLLFDRTLWWVCLMDAVLVLLFYACYRWLYRNKAEVVDGDTDRTMALTRLRRYNWGKCWLVIAWATGLFFGGLFLVESAWLFMALLLIYIVVVVGAVVGLELRVRRLQEKLTADSGGDFYVDEDDHWIWGMFYYNPNDRRLIVNDRVGMNTSVNLARRSGQVIMGASLALLLALPLVGVWLMGMEKAPVELVVTEEAVTASHYGSAFTVDREDIASLEVLEELPEIRRVAGTGLPSAQTGTFRSEDWGTFTCCIDPRQGPWLLIETVDGRLFLFNATDPAATETVLAEIGSTSFS